MGYCEIRRDMGYCEIRRDENYTGEGLEITNKQLKLIKEWYEAKQREENNKIHSELILSDTDYFRQFYIDFNLPDSVGLKKQSEIIAQNKSYNELYIKHRSLISAIKHLQEELYKEKVIDIKRYLSDIITNYNYIDATNEELMKRLVKF